jgi:hypothetical protein
MVRDTRRKLPAMGPFLECPPVKVYATIRQPGLSRSIHRINAALRESAPPDVELVDEPSAADLQILDVIGPEFIFDYVVVPRHVLILHCVGFDTQHRFAWSIPPSFWARTLPRAALTIAAQDMSDLADNAGFEFLLTPFGVDGSVFFDHGLARDRRILTTGYSLYGEAIWECAEAATKIGPTAAPQTLHVGFDYWRDGSVEVHEGVRDEQLAVLYSRSRYVSGLRRGEGFELPILEGLACGARPVCFDTPGYRRWFDGHAVFVPELESHDLTECLAHVLAEEPQPVTVAERDAIIRKFGWRSVCSRIWQRILQLSD